MRRAGRIFKYTKDGKSQKLVAYNDEQTDSFSRFDKILCRVINDDLSPKKTAEGKNVIKVVHFQDPALHLTGFID